MIVRVRMPARYRKVSKIADGGMAEIFLAIQHGAEGFERRVVLKQILAALLADPKFRNMLVDEALVAMSLNHSNIVQVLDLGQSKGRYFLVLELVDGWDLNRILGRMRSTGMALAPELALYMVAEVCRALNYAHAQTRGGQPLGIVHRDVSPHNVLISEQGEVKLTDFGIAKAMGRRERTGEGVIKGKLAFMSPEQASGKELDARSDLFAVGTMLYLLMVGKRPFESPTDLETILRVQQCQYPPPREVKPDLPAPIAAIVERAMQRDPASRYQTGEEMLLDLESAQRSVFRPAGQTELKRWLIQLGQKDNQAPTSRATPPPPGTEFEELDIDEYIIFEEEEESRAQLAATVRAASSASVIRAAEAISSRPPLPPGLTQQERVLSPSESPLQIPSGLSFPTLPSRRRWLVGGIVAGAALTTGSLIAWRMHSSKLEGMARGLLGANEPPQTPGGPPAVAAPTPSPAPAAAPPPTPSAPAPEPTPPAPAVAASPPDAQPRIAEEPAAARPDAGLAQAEGEPQPEEDEEEEDEEALLQRQEPDIAEKVIGDEPEAPAPKEPEPAPEKAEPPPAGAPVRRRVAAAAPSPSPPPARRPAAKEPASVRIESRPEGAVIKLGSRVFGRAPMNLRFNPGVTYELTFVKAGYQSTRKRFTPSRRKGQRVAVVLKKKPPPRRKSFFQRLMNGLKSR
jgi:serine/threonine-protein kinase